MGKGDANCVHEQAAKADCECPLYNKMFKLLIGGSTAGNACSMQRYKFEKNIFKLLIGGSTASGACSMQGDKKWKIILRKIMML